MINSKEGKEVDMRTFLKKKFASKKRISVTLDDYIINDILALQKFYLKEKNVELNFSNMIQICCEIGLCDKDFNPLLENIDLFEKYLNNTQDIKNWKPKTEEEKKLNEILKKMRVEGDNLD